MVDMHKAYAASLVRVDGAVVGVIAGPHRDHTYRAIPSPDVQSAYGLAETLSADQIKTRAFASFSSAKIGVYALHGLAFPLRP